MTPLTSAELEIINWVEYYWHRNSAFPPLNKFREKYGDKFSLEELVNKQSFRKAMTNRGISLPIGAERPEELTEEQLAAIIAVTNFMDKRSQYSKLKSLGISTTKWNGWLKNKDFKEYLHKLSASNFTDSIHVVQEGLLKKAETGDVNAVRFYYELTGRYSGQDSELENLKVVLARLGEILQIHIKDPELLRLIANDFQAVMNGNKIATPAAQIEGSI